MSGGGGKGGSTTQAVEIPAWLEGASQENIARAKQVANIDYMPYMGPTVAAQTPLQMAAMQNTSGAAGAFGMAGSGMTGMEGMPAPQQFAGGVTGYSDFPIYEQARNLYAEYDPANFAKRNALFGGTTTGAMGGAAPAAAAPAPTGLTDMERRMGLTPELKARGMTVADFMGGL